MPMEERGICFSLSPGIKALVIPSHMPAASSIEFKFLHFSLLPALVVAHPVIKIVNTKIEKKIKIFFLMLISFKFQKLCVKTTMPPVIHSGFLYCRFRECEANKCIVL